MNNGSEEYVEIPPSFESEFPEEAKILQGVCQERANFKAKGFPIAPLHLDFLAAPKIGRNDPCHCGSGKKYKKCCIDKE